MGKNYVSMAVKARDIPSSLFDSVHLIIFFTRNGYNSGRLPIAAIGKLRVATPRLTLYTLPALSLWNQTVPHYHEPRPQKANLVTLKWTRNFDKFAEDVKLPSFQPPNDDLIDFLYLNPLKCTSVRWNKIISQSHFSCCIPSTLIQIRTDLFK